MSCARTVAVWAATVATLSAIAATSAPAHVAPAQSATAHGCRVQRYWLGRAFHDHPLMTPDAEAVCARSRGPLVATFRYGACRAEGCTPAIEVQNWRSCARNLSKFRPPPNVPSFLLPPPPERLRVRGLPAAYFAQDPRIEIFTGDLDVVIFGDSRAQILAAADHLKRLGPGPTLAPPAPGSVTGHRHCSSAGSQH